jgi:hypothetical protein
VEKMSYWQDLPPPPVENIWYNGSSDSDVALDRLRAYGYDPNRLYKVTGMRDHQTERKIQPTYNWAVRNACTIAPFLTFLKVESLRSGHDFLSLLKWESGEGLELEEAIKDIIRIFLTGGPDGAPDFDRQAKLRWIKHVNLIRSRRHTMRNVEKDDINLEYDAGGCEETLVIKYLDSVTLFFLYWRCKGCPDLDDQGKPRLGEDGKAKMGRLKTETRCNFKINDVQDFFDVKKLMYKRSTLGRSHCLKCGSDHVLENIVFPKTTWMLIFDGPVPTSPTEGAFDGSMADLKYRFEMGGVDWKKAYTSWVLAPGAAHLIPGTKTHTGLYQTDDFGHVFSFQYIKGATYLHDDGWRNGKLRPWPFQYPAVDPVWCSRTVYIRCPPKPLQTNPNERPRGMPAAPPPPLPTVQISPTTYYVFPVLPNPYFTVQVLSTTANLPGVRSTPYFSYLPTYDPRFPIPANSYPMMQVPGQIHGAFVNPNWSSYNPSPGCTRNPYYRPLFTPPVESVRPIPRPRRNFDNQNGAAGNPQDNFTSFSLF